MPWNYRFMAHGDARFEDDWALCVVLRCCRPTYFSLYRFQSAGSPSGAEPSGEVRGAQEINKVQRMLNSAGLGLRVAHPAEGKQRAASNATEGTSGSGSSNTAQPSGSSAPMSSSVFMPPGVSPAKKVRGVRGPTAFAVLRFMLPEVDLGTEESGGCDEVASLSTSDSNGSGAVSAVSAVFERGDMVEFTVVGRRGPRQAAGHQKGGHHPALRVEKVALVRKAWLPCR